MRALITGGMGHVGGALAALLAARGDVVMRLDRSASPSEGLVLDVTDGPPLAALIRQQPFDAVFHLAGLGAAASPAELEKVNVGGTRAVLDAVRGVKTRLLVMSSSAVYGVCADDPITEESLLAPVTPYGASKLACEELARSAAAHTWVAIARPFNIVGPGQRAPMLQTAVLNQLVAIERGETDPVLKLGWLGNSRDFIDARDIAAGLVAILEKGQSGQAYNLCSGEATKTRALVEMLAQMSSKNIEIQDVKKKPSWADVPYQRGTAAKLQEVSGWVCRIPLQRALSDSLDWQRQQG